MGNCPNCHGTGRGLFGGPCNPCKGTGQLSGASGVLFLVLFFVIIGFLLVGLLHG